MRNNRFTGAAGITARRHLPLLLSAFGPALDPTQGGFSYQQTCGGCSYNPDTDVLFCAVCADVCGGIQINQPLPAAGACAENGNDIANCNGYLTCGGCG